MSHIDATGFACLCGGALEVGLFALIVTAVSAFITWIVNKFRRRRAT